MTRVPDGVRARAGELRRAIRRWQLRGTAVTCPLCGGSFAQFGSAGHPPRPGVECPGCGARERHRALWQVLPGVIAGYGSAARCLHVAPEPVLGRHLRLMCRGGYVGIDIVSPGADLRADIHRLPVRRGSFDIVVCSHVLEHVEDDVAALAELVGALGPGGVAVVVVPVGPNDITDEDVDAAPSDRLRRFGDATHVRLHGRDTARRFAAVAAVEEIDPLDGLGLDAIERFGLVPTPIHLCRPSGGGAV